VRLASRLDAQRVLLVVFLGAVFVMSTRIRPLFDPDLWWHLANGRYILAHGVPQTDVYSFTAVGHTWVVHEWLSDVAMYGLHRGGGLAALLVAAGVILVLAELLIYLLLRDRGLGGTTAVVLALVLGLASSSSWGARPQLLNLVLAAALCLLLLRYRSRPGRWLWAVVPGFVLWANLHSGYIFGFGLIALFLTGEALSAIELAASDANGDRGQHQLARPDMKRLFAVAILAGAAGLVTPAGYQTILFPFGTLGSTAIQSNIIEWESPDFRSLPGILLLVALAIIYAGGLIRPMVRSSPAALKRRSRWLPAVATIAVAAIAAVIDPDFHTLPARVLLPALAVAFLFWRAMNWRRPGTSSWTEVLWAVATSVLALTSVRNIPLLAAAGAPLLGDSAATLLQAAGARPRRVLAPARALALANAALLLGLGLAAAVFVATNLSRASLDRELRRDAPVAAVQSLLAGPISPQLFNYYDYGGYVIWAGYPRLHVFIDGRVEVYGDQLFARYLDISRGAPDWQAGLGRFDVHTVLMPAGSPMRVLLARAGWQLRYADGVAFVMSRG
jgi:hypothetical protein